MTTAPVAVAAPVEHQPVDGAWRRLAVRCAVVPATVLTPLTALAPTGDQRYDVYWHGATVRTMPWTLITANVGTFRPLGRIVEWTLDLTAYLMVEILRLPTEIALRVVAAVAAVVLTAAVVVFAEALTARGRMFATRPARPLALIPFGMAACLVAAGPDSTTVLFGGRYFLSTALVLAVAAWLCREPARVPLLIVAGAALAAVDEIAALALPFATVVVLVRGRLVLGLAPRLRPLGYLWLGFLPVWWWHLSACRGGDCDPGSDLVAGAGAMTAVPNRLTAWLPPLQWVQALHDAARPSQVVLGLAVVAAGLLVRRALIEVQGLTATDRRQATGLAAAGGTLLLLGAILGGLSAGGQAVAGGWGAGWRDSGVTAAGGVLLVAGVLGLWCRADLQRLALGGLAVLTAGSAAVNQAYVVGVDHLEPALVGNGIAGEVAQFDASDAGDARRCALRDRFAALPESADEDRLDATELPGTHTAAERLDVSLDMATVQMYGEVFCRRGL